ncbi:diaminopropionate ammonia-lyase [Paraburkholderia caribensis]|uniref:diaminopropionate ammonia-lyase n=1 Tax=Paraburkholderia caribensis TaxID=75105 RepID=UPI0007226320|nr:diaminopropionate ammonia-lyase [Paraburkholderia caribensis]ALP68547.1 PLP-dependent lyase/thiolase [Paraburkholderia caribensis]AUT57904.1 diaminopropionate ammonia-lyase [Paraburkholderia caribensis]
MLMLNPGAMRCAYPETLRSILNMEAAKESEAWLKTWEFINPHATPTWNLPDLASDTGVKRVVVKDESKRSSLESFKALGAPVALVRLLMRTHPDAGFTAPALLRGIHSAELRHFTVVSATDGNHGRALAAGARSVGCRCVIVIHRNVSEERRAAIAQHGAEVIRIQGSYDESVVEADRLAREYGWHVVSDTSYEGYETIPRDVMQGYATIAAEVSVPTSDRGVAFRGGYTHVFIPGGVGGLAAGLVSYFWEQSAERRPTFVVVEPEQADCLYQSAIRGTAAEASGTVDSVMAGLACGKASPLAWRFLRPAVDAFLTIRDSDAVAAMRRLAEGTARDIPMLGGESGAASLAGLLSVAGRAAWRDAIGLDANSRVLLISTEGATAPDLYARLSGHSPQNVLSAQGAWLAHGVGATDVA